MESGKKIVPRVEETPKQNTIDLGIRLYGKRLDLLYFGAICTLLGSRIGKFLKLGGNRRPFRNAVETCPVGFRRPNPESNWTFRR